MREGTLIEAHPVLHYLAILAVYNVGLAVNVLAAAYVASQSKINSIEGIGQYFKLRWVPVSIRWFLCLCLFLVVWGNPSVLDLERYMPNFPAHLGVSGMLGWLSDSVWDKVLAVILPGIQKELPVVPPPQQP